MVSFSSNNLSTILTRKGLFETLLYLIAFSLPLVKPHWNSKLIIAFAIVWLFSVKKENVIKNLAAEKLIILLFCSLFIFDVVGLVHSDNTHYGLKYLESKFTILLLPILIIGAPELFSRKIIDRTIKSLATGILVLMCYCIWIFMRANSEEVISLNFFLTHRLTEVQLFENGFIAFHPSFISVYISFIIFYLVEKSLTSGTTKSEIFFNVAAAIVLLVFEVLLNSRAAIAGLIIGAIFFAFLVLKRKQQIVALLFIGGFAAGILTLPVSRERIIDAPLRAIKQGPLVDASDPSTWPISFRFQIVDCSIHILKNNNWLFGHGTGDFRDRITRCYNEKQYEWIIVRDFDAHSEYFSQLHRHGILGLIAFLLCLIVPAIIAIKLKEPLYAVFLLLISISALPESIFTSQKGVVFYALFNSLLFLRTVHRRLDSCEKSTV